MGVLYALCFSLSLEDYQELNETNALGSQPLITRNQSLSEANSWKWLPHMRGCARDQAVWYVLWGTEAPQQPTSARTIHASIAEVAEAHSGYVMSSNGEQRRSNWKPGSCIPSFPSSVLAKH